MKKNINLLIFLLLLLKVQLVSAQISIYEFNQKTQIEDWKIINDDVMGGVSSSSISLNTEGFAVFKGAISLDNNGGFASVRHNLNRVFINNKKELKLNIKGDGKEYQIRIKKNNEDYYSYVKTFKTSGKWELITIELKDMYPTFRGRELDLKNFNKNSFEQIAFLIGNNKNENFQLLIKEIILQ